MSAYRHSAPKPGTPPWPGGPDTKKGGNVPTTPPVTAKPKPLQQQQADAYDASPQQAR